MDLFDNLPAPVQQETSKSPEPALFSAPATDALFGDLPPAKEVTSGGQKRKLQSNDEEEKNTKFTKSEEKDSCRLRLQSFVSEVKGERDEMQDAHIVIHNLLPQLPHQHPAIQGASYFGVFDGHGGARASKFAAKNIHQNIIKHFPKGTFEQLDKGMKKCFVDSFKKTDEDFLKEARARKPAWKDGTTAVSILVINNVVYIANLGDSKAVLCRHSSQLGKYVTLPLTRDHNPSNYEERIRIQKTGGHVTEGRVMGILEVSRSIGDGPYKNHGVSCMPDIKRCELTPSDRYILIACDGLWKTFNNQTAMEFINKILDDPGSEDLGEKLTLEIRYETACGKLAREAVRRLSADNVTVMIVALMGHNPTNS